MEQMQKQAGEVVSQKKRHPRKTWKKALFGIIWLYILTKLLVYDIDIYVLSRVWPHTGPSLLHYKGFVVLGVLVILLLTLRPKVFLRNVLHFGAFPFIALVWHLPRLVFKGTAGFVGQVIAVLSFLGTKKVRFTAWIGAASSAVVLVLDMGKVGTIASMCFLLVFLMFYLGRRFWFAFAPSPFLQGLNQKAARFLTWLKKDNGLQDVAALEKLKSDPEAYGKQCAKTLRRLVLVNRGMTLVASWLRQVQESRLVTAFLLFRLGFTFVLTVIVFAFEYFGLALLDPGAIAGPRASGFLNYVYLSFATITTMGSGDIYVVSDYGVILACLQVLSGVVIGVILFFVFTTIISARYQTGLQELIDFLEGEVRVMNTEAKAALGLDIDEIETKVTNESPDLVPILKRLKRAQ